MQKKNFLITGIALLALLIGAGCTHIPNSPDNTIQEPEQLPVENTQGPQETDTLSSNKKSTVIPRSQVGQFKHQLPDPCEFDKIDRLHLSTNQETEWKTYKNSKKGLEMSIPYNPHWGSPEYQLNPYDEYDNGLSFGTINVRGEGCGAWVPGTQRLDFLPAETLAETLARLQQESDALPFGYTIRSLTIDGKEVVEYIKDGLCGGGGTIIIGEKYNYELSTTCSANTREDIIKSMKITE